jgi:hypothetical protein
MYMSGVSVDPSERWSVFPLELVMVVEGRMVTFRARRAEVA